jgi:hypothetical protein
LLVGWIAFEVKLIAVESDVFTRDSMAMGTILMLLGRAMLLSYLKSKGNSQLGRLTGVALLVLPSFYYTLLF